MADEVEPQVRTEGLIYIQGKGENRYWHEVETGVRSGEWTSAGAGPPVSVVVTPLGLELYGSGLPGSSRVYRPGQARWLACRILEALGVYETTFAGDGSAPPGGGGRAPLVIAGGTSASVPTSETTYVCGCGKVGSNMGGMRIHEKKCKVGGVRTVKEN